MTHLIPILLPLCAGFIALLMISRKNGALCAFWTLAVTAVTLVCAALQFGKEWTFVAPWCGFGFEFALRLYHFSAFIVLASSGFGFLIALYSLAFMKDRSALNQYYSYFLFTLGMVNGAAMADNFILLLFFWEGLLLTLFGMIIIGHPGAFKTAIKAFIISGVADLCMMIGVGIAIHMSGTATLSQIRLPVSGLGGIAFILLMIGAIAKAGSMPFHSWIPDAAIDAPLPFMALVPAALEKLLGIYFLARISLDLFQLDARNWLSPLMMIIGCVTILLAVMMALIQKDYKRLLSFHAISQVGYMILGIGTCVPIGIVGGIFHMINHALYKSCLFLTGGAVEKQAGTTDLRQLGGLKTQMPVTFICFVVAAAAISGVPPFNGFFSKELVYDGAMERGMGYYIAAVLGSFFTAASFLKLGHAAFLGKPNPALKVSEAPVTMLIPMIVIAGFCILFGLYNALPLDHLIQPILGEHRLEGHHFAGWPDNTIIVGLTVVVLVGAVLNHLFGVKRSGSGLGAADHIHNAPILHTLYDKAEQRVFDPYEIGLKLIKGLSLIAWIIDRIIDFVYDTVIVKLTYGFTGLVRIAHTGSLMIYLLWSLAGLAVIILLMMGGM